ncbi:hypothetical protein AVEN_68714-1 [Araneus ventricosus]|uniref:Uncharacterized protein n=1 Tax=Araneus ventricosus TaxID=182803 RepID=A0A4Y2V701_ARAVE|nr:hypothetical protein AVEN_68714-1 [Araneus ventricosus]
MSHRTTTTWMRRYRHAIGHHPENEKFKRRHAQCAELLDQGVTAFLQMRTCIKNGFQCQMECVLPEQLKSVLFEQCQVCDRHFSQSPVLVHLGKINKKFACLTLLEDLPSTGDTLSALPSAASQS